jgi:hypothetical protein
MAKKKVTQAAATRQPTKRVTTQEQLEQAEKDVINLRWSAKEATVRDALEELRWDMLQVQTAMEGTADQLYEIGGISREGHGLLALSIVLRRFAEFMAEKLAATDSLYMSKLPAGRP